MASFGFNAAGVAGALVVLAIVVLALTGHCSGGVGFNVGIH